MHDVGVRVRALNYILTETKLDGSFFKFLIEKIVDKDVSLTRDNQKSFVNSLSHHERFRLWQFVLVLLPRLDQVRLGLPSRLTDS